MCTHLVGGFAAIRKCQHPKARRRLAVKAAQISRGFEEFELRYDCEAVHSL